MTGKFVTEVQSCLPGSTPSVIACGDATFPKGTAFGGDGKVSGTAQKLPLRGKTSPAPGEDVTVGDKRGSLARRKA